ncbi:hypothetical protein chiPu_0033765, partial [Chiloscyllium punctatum]|nr:hypothetical protein [Chiloscyllium punctatum]
MGLRPARKAALARARFARSVFHLEAVDDLRQLPDPELPDLEARRLQRLVQRRVRK